MSQAVNARPSQEELSALSEEFEQKPPQEILAYAYARYFPKIVLACSFGAEDVVIADMIFRINPKATIFYLDTDFLFSETFEVRDRIVAKYGLQGKQVLQIKSLLTPEEQDSQYGGALWLRNPDQCCELRKLEPLSRVLKDYSAWITGVRREQSITRATTRMIHWDEKFDLLKFNPLAMWSWDQVWDYIRDHDVPYNTLHEHQYPSIGCTHCTAPVMPGDDLRSGRWKNSVKTECGLHR